MEDEKQFYRRAGTSKINFSLDHKFPIGNSVQVVFGSTRKVFTTLRGVCFGSYILVDTPAVNGRAMEINYDDAVDIRFVKTGKIYSFKTYLLRTHPKLRLMVFEYPDVITEMNLRKSARLSLVAPVKAVASRNYDTTSIDFSEHGILLCFEGQHNLNISEEIMLSFGLQPPFNISIDAQIKNVNRLDGKSLIGISFSTGDKEANKKIDKLYYKFSD